MPEHRKSHDWTDGRGDFTPSQNRYINDCNEFHEWLSKQDELERIYLTPDLSEGMRQAELLSFLGFDHVIAGVPVFPLTLGGLILASACGCAYIDGGTIEDRDADIMAYILLTPQKDSKLKPSDVSCAADYRFAFGIDNKAAMLDYVSACWTPLECLPSNGSNSGTHRKTDGIWVSWVLYRVWSTTGLKPREIMQMSILQICHHIVQARRISDKESYDRPCKAEIVVDAIRAKMWEIIDRDGVE